MTILRCLKNFAYNQDRALASLFGADPQATISSEIGRHEPNVLAKAVGSVLDLIQKGHVRNAEEQHAALLKAADNGHEQ